jgi:hypothetical protein
MVHLQRILELQLYNPTIPIHQLLMVHMRLYIRPTRCRLCDSLRFRWIQTPAERRLKTTTIGGLLI